MRDVLQSGQRFLRNGWFLAFVLIALPNCAFSTIGTCEGDCPPQCEPGDKECEAPCDENVKCEPPPCDPNDPKCQPPCDPNDPKCDPPCDPNDPTCNPPCDPNDPTCDPPDPVKVFDPGPTPTDAIMCDFPEPLPDGVSACATAQEAADATNISLTEAAIALNTGKSKSFALDWSPAALAECAGLPKKQKFMSPFPKGETVCINCGDKIPVKYADTTAACVARCTDLINFGGGFIPKGGAAAFCLANAKTSTNFDKTTCYHGACTGGGNPDTDNFADPRIPQEPAVWVDLIGTAASGNDVTRTLPTTGPNPEDFQAGAATAQTIAHGDAWVELHALENNLTHVLGVRNSCLDASNCPDVVPSLDDIGFAIDLASDGQIYVLESGPSLGVQGPFGPYAAGERFRVRMKDNHDGTATVSYSRVVGACMPGTPCTEDVFFQSAATPSYPLRVNTSFREQNATIANVTLVRIQQ